MKLYSISIHPTDGIGYCFVTKGYNAMHAISVLSHSIRTCLKAGVSNEEEHLLETLRIIRKPWRLTKSRTWGSYQQSRYPKVKMIEADAVKASYDAPLIPFKSQGHVGLSLTCNYHDLAEKLSPRTKPSAHRPKTNDWGSDQG